MSSQAASSSTGYESSREEASPPDLLYLSGLESAAGLGSREIKRNCPRCGAHLPSVAKEIAQLRDAVESREAQHQQQCKINLNQSYYCRELENKCEVAERDRGHLQKKLKIKTEHMQELKRKVEHLQKECKKAEIHNKTEVSVLLMKVDKLKEWNNQLEKEQKAASIELVSLKDSKCKWKEEVRVLRQKYRDFEERIYQGERSLMKTREECKRLRDVLAKAFCKSRLTATELHKVIVQHIPNDQEHIRTWVDFLNPLEMPQGMMCLKGMSPCDARGNVYHVLLAWLEGKGSPGKPRTWGTLLDAMRRAPQYLQELANRAEYILLEELASLRMNFHVCVICRREILQGPSEETAAAGGGGMV